MNLQPYLDGKLLTLRPLKKSDFEALYAAASDPLIWTQHPKADRFKRIPFQFFFDEAIASKGALAVIENATREVIGTSRYYKINTTSKLVV